MIRWCLILLVLWLAVVATAALADPIRTYECRAGGKEPSLFLEATAAWGGEGQPARVIWRGQPIEATHVAAGPLEMWILFTPQRARAGVITLTADLAATWRLPEVEAVGEYMVRFDCSPAE